MGAILPGVPRPVVAVAVVLVAWLVARIVGERIALSWRVLIVVVGAALACLILAPMLVA